MRSWIAGLDALMPAVDDPEMRFPVLSAQRELHLVRHLDG
jgi:hypothetical protein